MNQVSPAVDATTVAMLDAVFPLQGQALARDHALALRHALCALWPWLAEDPLAGIHPLKLVPGSEALAPLSRRARLVLRVPALRMRDFADCGEQEIRVIGQALRIGPPTRRALRPHSAMYAYRVAAQGPDEVGFMAMVGRELERLGIKAARVCGKHQRLTSEGAPLDVFSLLLHEMTPQDALRLQQCGLGDQRLLGCGVFVPHKSAAAV